MHFTKPLTPDTKPEVFHGFNCTDLSGTDAPPSSPALDPTQMSRLPDPRDFFDPTVLESFVQYGQQNRYDNTYSRQLSFGTCKQKQYDDTYTQQEQYEQQYEKKQYEKKYNTYTQREGFREQQRRRRREKHQYIQHQAARVMQNQENLKEWPVLNENVKSTQKVPKRHVQSSPSGKRHGTKYCSNLNYNHEKTHKHAAQGAGQSKGWCGSGKDAQIQNGSSLDIDVSRNFIVRSATQVLVCHSSGREEFHVCAANKP